MSNPIKKYIPDTGGFFCHPDTFFKELLLRQIIWVERTQIMARFKIWLKYLLSSSHLILFKINFESFKLNLINFNKTPPVLIYQMGKVGSQAIYASLLKARLPTLTYLVHFLSSGRIQEIERCYSHLNDDSVSEMLKLSQMLHEKVVNHRQDQWKIITLAREPIGFVISQLFQIIRIDHPDLLDANGQAAVYRIIDYLSSVFDSFDEVTDYASTWFDNELKQVFNVDVYAYPFNHNEGFTITKEGNISVLVIRFEDLNRCFSRVAPSFLGLNKPIDMLNLNTGKCKWYASAYEYILNNIQIPKTVSERIYSTKYARHFYTENMISGFITKWSGKR